MRRGGFSKRASQTLAWQNLALPIVCAWKLFWNLLLKSFLASRVVGLLNNELRENTFQLMTTGQVTYPANYGSKVSLWSGLFLWVGVRFMYPHSVMWIHIEVGSRLALEIRSKAVGP